MNQQTTWISTMTKDDSLARPWIVPESGDQEQMLSVRLTSLLEEFSTISLSEMESVSLLNRTDTKFVLPISSLTGSLGLLRPWYKVLVVQGRSLNRYRSLYFDTPDFDLYNLHINDRAERFKVRSREYLDSRISYLEVKHRTRKDRTIKNRILTQRPDLWKLSEADKWLNGVLPYNSRDLEPKIWNTFERITLVSKDGIERVTVDVNICFFAGHKVVYLDGIAVAEVKLDVHTEDSHFLDLMRTMKIPPQGFSKYCIGTSLLYDNVKKNSMKSKILWIERNAGGIIHE
jgi:hypothetical protein